jgi:hypothetical protein
MDWARSTNGTEEEHISLVGRLEETTRKTYK